MPRLVSGRGRTDSPGPQYVKCRSFKWMTTLSSLRSPAAAASTSITPSPFAPLISASLSTSSCTRKRSTYAALWFVFPRPARAAPRCWKGPHPMNSWLSQPPTKTDEMQMQNGLTGGGTLVEKLSRRAGGERGGYSGGSTPSESAGLGAGSPCSGAERRSTGLAR